MTYICACCGAVVTGRVVLIWIALRVRVAEERCPGCGRWAKFGASEDAPLFRDGERAA